MASTAPSLTVLITGANTGLGFEIAKALFRRPERHHILIGCRGDIGRASDAISELKQLSPDSASTAEPLSIDVTSDKSIAAAVDEVRAKIGHLDVLVNNAGAQLEPSSNPGGLTPREAWNASWDVNVTGAQLLTEAFIPLLLAAKSPTTNGNSNPRILFMTSGTASLVEATDETSPRHRFAPPGWPKQDLFFSMLSYRAAKTGLNMVAAEWARLLRNDGVRVFDISPGFLTTGLGKDRRTGKQKDLAAMGALEPRIGGEFCADVVQGKRDDQAWPPKVLRRDMVQPW